MLRKTLLTLGLLAAGRLTHADINLSQIPLFVSKAVPPLSMLVLGRDHTLFFEAYNDASDIDGDSVLDLHFKPSIQYYGLFDSNLCYSHSGGSANSDLFTPAGTTSQSAQWKCPGQWSGNWLNYVTTSRIDALRKVLYGGHRETDTETQTILRRAYIPQDSHSWAKEYTSQTEDGYLISDYTPLSQPETGKRHFFGNVTMGASTNCKTLSNCSNLPPYLSVVTNSTARVWDWASSESPVLNGNTHKGSRKNYTVRVEVCSDDYPSANSSSTDCKRYSNGHYKPVGLLHEFGEDGTMLFGLLTGSYDKNMSGGVLRKVVSQFQDEIDAQTGRFSSNATIVKALNNLRIRDYNNGKTSSEYYNDKISNQPYKIYYRTGIMEEGHYVDWGNPIGEMMYETLRYFAGKKSPTEAFKVSGSSTQDSAVGLTSATWDDPYASNSAAKAKWCAKPNMLVMSNLNVSYDSDQLPGSAFGSFSGDLDKLNVSTQADKITTFESSVPGLRFIGAVGDNEDYAPTAKQVTTLGNIRGLSPEEPTKQGSYYSASIARYGSTTDLRSSTSGDQTTDTYVVALASPLPKFEFTVGENTISLVPFAKTIKGQGADRTKDQYQPTDPIADLYVEEYSATGAKFRVNFEADEQGSDFDTDVMVTYEIKILEGKLIVQVTPTAESTGSNQNLGYVISGTDRDGVYLVVQDKNTSLNYFLNVPPDQNAGYCNPTPSQKGDPTSFPAGCAKLPWINGTGKLNGQPANTSTQAFIPSQTPAATTLNNPLWYAAKYGIAGRDTTTIDGDPDNYFLVTNALTLKEQLRSAFNKILQNNASVNSPSVDRSSATTDDTAYVYRTDFDIDDWTGDLIKQKQISTSTGIASSTVWKASENIPIPISRKIWMADDTNSELVPFEWDNLQDKTFKGQNLQTALNKASPDAVNTDGYGEARVAFVRGSCQGISGCTTFRSRTSILGDIIDSSPALVKNAQYLAYRAGALDGGTPSYITFQNAIKNRTPMVYVGANDGMLHGFNANTGVEAFAFVPTPVIENLNLLTSTEYGGESGNHQYYVNGTPTVADVYFGNAWHTVLVGSLGAGGRGVFALDITDPAAPELLWEFTSDNDADMGYSIPKPEITRLHSGQWAALVPNGYNSSANKAVLFALDIETGEIISKLAAQTDPDDTYTDASNGLSNIRTADFNSDGITDYVYAGDLLGNLWRFDLYDPTVTITFGKCTENCSAIKDQFRVSFGGKPLYVAKDGEGKRQPISAAPTLIRHPLLTGYLVAFGTGRYLTLPDKASTQTQSLYGIWDLQTAGQDTSEDDTDKSRSNLSESTLSAAPNDNTRRLITGKSITWYKPDTTDLGDPDAVKTWGWYMDLKVDDSADGERLINNMALYGSGLIFSTVIPDSDICTANLKGFTYAINLAGERTTYDVFDLNNDGIVNYLDGLNGEVVSGYETPAGGFTISNTRQYYTDGTSKKLSAGNQANGRQSWRLLPAASSDESDPEK
ncbi:pilus assembly protein [Azomonas macrocytogenes]|uniref:Type IV pilus assembly protein PilY1 n=1 Tax=Azomonas macrocytogenes TaxID=69962 RepID=A0A839SYB6_AZOMA|nr:PilC/PilY family type IV pilus protein [Azomonas macrocytogenes]MBB3102112.1 type IV pilus assembly protein PilY1 [Azomonas macrocytogenes]